MKHLFLKYFVFTMFVAFLLSCTDKENGCTSIELSKDKLYFESNGGEQTVSITPASGWSYTSDKENDWCTIKQSNNGLITVTASPNTGEERKTTFQISYGSANKNLYISQTGGNSGNITSSIPYPIAYPDDILEATKDEQGNIIPDFSNIGYMGSEKSIPGDNGTEEVPVVKTIEPLPKISDDATSLIQNAIDEVAKLNDVKGFKGAILLKKGTYSVSGSININTSGIILRGEGTETCIKATGTSQRPLIKVVGNGSLTPSEPSEYNIIDQYVPVGQYWVRVDNSSDFAVGDAVTVYRPATQQWISDIKMDNIENANSSTVQWTPESYNLACERKITYILGDTLHFDNPIMMSLDKKYSGSAVYRSSFMGRIKNCGIENMRLESYYKSDEDTNHANHGVQFDKVEHSWMRNVESYYFSIGLVKMSENSRFITIKNCKCKEAKSPKSGGWRYSYYIDRGQQCLVIDCESSQGRHDCVTGPTGVGPNAFVRVNITNIAQEGYSDSGPHQRWNVGTLYDNIDSEGYLYVQDRAESGTGHGWAGANQVFWNCNAVKLCAQNPWTSAKNYCIGCIGEKFTGRYERPDGVWYKHQENVSPQSLFDAQLELRMSNGRLYHK